MTGATILGLSGPVLTAEERAFFTDADPWAFILFARNVETPEQLRRLTTDLRGAVGREAPILIDQEGGRVQRLRAPHWREWLAPLEQMQRATDAARSRGKDAVAAATRAMALRYRIIAHELRDVGIDANCAPLADIASSATHPFLLNRCFGTETDIVVQAARAVAEAHLAGGVLPIVKHLPGHGRATVDSHLDLPRVDAPLEELRTTDFAAFRALNDLPLAMTAHIVYSAVDPDAPATCSPAMMRLVRDEIGFDGAIMSDDVSMESLSGTIGQRSAAAIAGGCDLTLHCNGRREEMVEVVANSGTLSGQALIRTDRALSARTAPLAFDLAAAEEELAWLLAAPAHA